MASSRFLRFLHRFLPPRLGPFFVGGPELVLETELVGTEVSERLRKTLGSAGWLTRSAGAVGSVSGDKVHVAWHETAWLIDSFEPVFHGRIVDTSEGSRLIGGFSGGRLAKVLLGVWCGAVALISLAFMWTVFLPLAGWGLLWMLNGLMWLSESWAPDRRMKIESYLRQTVPIISASERP